MGKQFQPHESHIPYILKFFIDYNLFGMSFLHVPLQFVNTRPADDKSRFRKRSVSQLEVDFKAVYILNRLAAGEQEQDASKAANPGIESIWEDERLRRSALDSVPPLESMISQANECPATESDLFFKTILREKLAGSTVTFGEGSNESPAPRRKFDTKNFHDASVYAAEFSEHSISTKSSQEDDGKSLDESQTIEELENRFLNFSESPDEEVKVLETLDDDSDFEADSALAPLTQATADDKPDPNQTLIAQESTADDDSDGEMFNELNETVADMEIFSQYVDDTKIPQLDGVDDELSPSEVTLNNDRKRNLFHQPGPSHIFIPAVKLVLPSPSSGILNQRDVQDNLQQLAGRFRSSPGSLVADEEDDDDDHMRSFYNQSMFVDESSESGEEVEGIKSENVCIITPSLAPPDPSEVPQRMAEFNIPKFVHPSPFYSNPKDVTGKKEVGHNILEVTGKRLCDLEDFKPALHGSSRLEDLRSERFKDFGIFTSAAALRDFFRPNETVVCPCKDPPSYHDAVSWLKTFAGEETQPEGESPVKEKRERTLMVLEQDDEVDIDLDVTLKPSTPDVIHTSQEKDSSSLSQFFEDDFSLSYSARKKRNKMKKSFSRRFQEIMKAKAASSKPDVEDSQQTSEDIWKFSESSNSSRSSDQTLTVQNANLPEDLSFHNSCDLTGPSLNDTYGFRMKLESLQSNSEHTDLTLLAMELHIQTRRDLKPNPELDAISAIFYSLDGHSEVKTLNGIITTISNLRYIKQGVDVQLVGSEMEIFEAFFQKIREFDPDIFAGYEIETASWGYLVQRGYMLNLNLNNALSRMPTEKAEAVPAHVEDEDHDAGDYNSEQKIPGRILLDVWRLMRHEIALTSYTFENVSYHVLHRR